MRLLSNLMAAATLAVVASGLHLAQAEVAKPEAKSSASVLHSVTVIPPLHQGFDIAGVAINNFGEVAGQAWNGSQFTAFLYTNGNTSWLAPPYGNSSVGTGINDARQVIATAYKSLGPAHAFLYSAGMWTDLGDLGAPGATASGINSTGQVTGTSAANSKICPSHAYFYDGAAMKDLGGFKGLKFGAVEEVPSMISVT